jgi:hypothetical protein
MSRLALGVCFLLAACAQPVCSLESCEGCCDELGHCALGMSQNRCGAGGRACAACNSGESCREGNCVVTRVTPDAGLCDGIMCSAGYACDPADGVCRCGGELCSSGQYCDAGSCVRRGNDGGLRCSPNNCNGCCVNGDTCLPGNTNAACGSAGRDCYPCQGSCLSGRCVADDGGTCNASNCHGCCRGLECLPGDAGSACGVFGQTCGTCRSDERCSGSGTCIPPCDATNCSGCCTPEGTCATGLSNFGCGAHGVACSSCPLSAPCGDAGACVPVCNASNCSGCCIGTSCIAPGSQSSTACGFGGSACLTCAAPSSCANGRCTNPDGGYCDRTRCAGCCDSAECRLGNSDSQCGVSGAQCTACRANERCGFGNCGEAMDGGCGPMTCGGCCSGGRCGTFPGDLYCGMYGVQCSACDVAANQRCVNSECVGTVVGAACPVGCSLSLWCKQAVAYVNGYCTRSCGSNAICGTGVCIDVGDGGGECRSSCGSGCRPGYVCTDAGVCDAP